MCACAVTFMLFCCFETIYTVISMKNAHCHLNQFTNNCDMILDICAKVQSDSFIQFCLYNIQVSEKNKICYIFNCVQVRHFGDKKSFINLHFWSRAVHLRFSPHYMLVVHAPDALDYILRSHRDIFGSRLHRSLIITVLVSSAAWGRVYGVHLYNF